MKQNNTNLINPSPPSHKIRLLLAIWAISFGIFLVNDLPIRSKYNATVNELEKFKSEVMEPAGAVQQPGEEKRGNGILNVIFDCGPDVGCPTVAADWYTPIEPGKEAEFLTSILERYNYQAINKNINHCAELSEENSCGITGLNDNFRVGLDLQATGSRAPNPPSTDVSPKIWRSLSLRITAR